MHKGDMSPEAAALPAVMEGDSCGGATRGAGHSGDESPDVESCGAPRGALNKGDISPSDVESSRGGAARGAMHKGDMSPEAAAPPAEIEDDSRRGAARGAMPKGDVSPSEDGSHEAPRGATHKGDKLPEAAVICEAADPRARTPASALARAAGSFAVASSQLRISVEEEGDAAVPACHTGGGGRLGGRRRTAHTGYTRGGDFSAQKASLAKYT